MKGCILRNIESQFGYLESVTVLYRIVSVSCLPGRN